MSQLVIKRESSLKRVPIEKEFFTIGRDKSSDLSLVDLRVSRRHAEIRLEDGCYVIYDMWSKNGTFVNGQLVKQQVLNEGDEIRLGDTLLIFVGDSLEPFQIAIEERRRDNKNIVVISEPETTVILPSPEGKRLEELKKANQRLSALVEIGRVIDRVYDLSELLERVMSVIFKIMPVERGFIMMVDEDNPEKLIPYVSQKNQEDKRGITVSKSIINHVLKEGVSILIPDTWEDERFKERESVIVHRIRSAMCVPMKSREMIKGIIYVDNKIGAGSFSKDDLELLTFLANQAGIAVENAQLHARLLEENRNLQKAIATEHKMVGNSPKMKRLYGLIEKVSQSDSTILLRGETGTGKELIAEAIHYKGVRKGKLFMCVNCTVLSESLLESELFGHEKGAFTGAVARKMGKFELANGGTVFLDEIGDVSLNVQLKLLRFLQEREFERVGGTETIKVDVRIIAATNKDLEEAIKIGKFREDLYFRLKVIEIKVPPLRERREDIPLLAEYFLETYGGQGRTISKNAMELLQAYHWPGNVRELKNAIERAVILGSKEALMPEDLPPEIRGLKGVTIGGVGPLTPLSQLEREHIINVLKHTKGNKRKAAEILGVDRSTLYEKIKNYRI